MTRSNSPGGSAGAASSKAVAPSSAARPAWSGRCPKTTSSAGEYSRSRCAVISPTVPSPTTAIRSPGLGWPRVIPRQATAAGSASAASARLTARCRRSPGGRGQRVHDLGGQQQLVGGGAGPGEADLVVGQAQVGVAAHALRADPVGDDALGDHRLARRQRGHARPDRLDHAGPLVPGHQRIAHVGGVDDPVEQLEVGPADADVGRAGDHLARSGDERGHVPQRDDARLGDDERAVVSHGCLLCYPSADGLSATVVCVAALGERAFRRGRA